MGRPWYLIVCSLSVFLLVGFVATAAVAQQVASDADEIKEVPQAFETVITPTRISAPVIDSDRTTIRVGTEEIEKNLPNDLMDALVSQGGFHPQRTNLGAAAPIIRGLVGPQNLILVDGLRFNNSTFRTGPNQYLALLDPFAMSAMELLLGPGSVLYGSDAIGGVINALPLRHHWGSGMQGRLGSSVNSADSSISNVADFSASNDDVSVWAGARLRSHGALRVGGGDLIPLSNFVQRDWRTSVSVNAGSGWTVTGTYLGGEIEGAGRVDQLGKGDVRVYDNMDHFAYLDARYSGTGAVDGARIAGLYHRTEEAVDRYSCVKGENGFVSNSELCSEMDVSQITRVRRYADHVDTVGLLGELNWAFFDERLRVLLGMEGYLDLVSSSLSVSSSGAVSDFVIQDRGNFSDGSHYFQTGVFLYSEGELFEHDLLGVMTASIGARATYAGAFAPDVPGIGDINYDDFGVVYTGGLRQTIDNRFAMFANYSQGFRLPNLQEATVLGDVGSVFEVPNDGLRSERSHTLEFGGRVIAPTGRLSISYFHSWVTDLIVREASTFSGQSTVDGKDVFRRTNAGEARFSGIQAQVHTDSWLGFALESNLSLTLGEFVNAGGDLEPARRVPPLFGRTAIHYSSEGSPVRVSVYMDWADEKTDLSPKDKKDLRICGDPNSPGRLLDDCDSFDGYVIPGVMVQWKPTDSVSVLGEVRNILDSNYRTFGSGVDAPGISAHVGAVVHY